MVFREDPAGLMVITQPAHAWISGQLARHWGDAGFGDVAPFEEVCFAAEQHDLGFLPWEGAPTLNPKSGRPHDFMSMPTAPHLAVWSAGVQALSAYSRYAALLVSLHVTHLCANHKVDRSPLGAQAAQNFLAQQKASQAQLLATLLADPLHSPYCAAGVLTRNRQLIATWDWMSLVFCQGQPGEAKVLDVPSVTGAATLTLSTPVAGATHVKVSPWPFRTREVKLVCDGRRLSSTFTDEQAMRAALCAAPSVAVCIDLTPA